MIRPLWFDFQEDATAQGVADQFMYKLDYMVAHVLDKMPFCTRVSAYKS